MHVIGIGDLKIRGQEHQDAGNFHGSRLVAKDRMLQMCFFLNDSDVNILSFLKTFDQRSNIL